VKCPGPIAGILPKQPASANGSDEVAPEPISIQPSTAGEVAAALKRASDSRQSIVIRGAGTKDDWGRPPGRIDAVLDMRAMNRILAHEQGDLTATIEAGARLRDVNQALAIHAQMLPLDPPFADRCTIGGLLATNDSGPMRHRYGTPRDLVIGIQLATTDGVLAKAGGQVVKNVAGYDLSKLMTGSFGSLAAIVSATFKLSPLPAASTTMMLGARDAAAVAEIVRTMMASQLEPVAVELSMGTQSPQSTQNKPSSPGLASRSFHVFIRFASLPAVVSAQVAQASAALESLAGSIDVVDGDAERALWDSHATGIWDQPGAVIRASWLPANLAAVVDELAGPKRCAMAMVGRAAVGAGLIRIEGEAAEQARTIEQLRTSSVFGNVVIVRGSPALKALVDVWGSHGSRQPLFDSLKRAFDPGNVLNAGRGPL
jgi:glycolate dehydrogenase FAD-binding subunit